MTRVLGGGSGRRGEDGVPIVRRRSQAQDGRMEGDHPRGRGVANDGLEAVDVAETFHPELVLLDIGLPKLNGYEVARRICQQPWGRDVILVAMTGWGQDEDRRRALEAGFNFHIVKPMELAALEELLAGCVQTAGRR